MDINIWLREIEELEQEIINYRRDFHKHPEYGFETFRTSKIIADYLERLGYFVRRNAAVSGVIADLKSDYSGNTLLLRADIDALKITELNDCEYKSVNEGLMHACGHDAHAAMLMGAAEIIIKHKEQIPGNVRLVFQPSEESVSVINGEETWGGKYMVRNECVLDNVNMCFALHVDPLLETGCLNYNKDEAMAGSSGFKVVFKGKSTHIANPDKGIDAIYMATDFISQIQRITTKEIDPFDVALIYVGTINGGTSRNIVASSVEITGGFRTYSTEVTKQIWESLEVKLRGIETSYGAECELIKLFDDCPPVVNDAKANIILSHGANYSIDSNCIYEITTKRMTGEDFAEYSMVVPGCFAWLGVGNQDQGIVENLHNNRFAIDESALVTGSKVFLGIVFEYFKKYSNKRNL